MKPCFGRGNQSGVANFGSAYFGDPGAGDYAEFENDGTLILHGAAKAWDDLRVPMTSTKLGASNDPNFTIWIKNGTSQGIFLYWFDKNAEEELYFALQVPHACELNPTLSAHVHFVPKTNGGAGAKVCWGLEYAWFDTAGTVSQTTIVSGNQHAPADTALVANKHYLTEIADITGAGATVSSMLVGRIFRDATGALRTDDYDDDAGLLEIDFHVEKDSLGSRTEYTK